MKNWHVRNILFSRCFCWTWRFPAKIHIIHGALRHTWVLDESPTWEMGGQIVGRWRWFQMQSWHVGSMYLLVPGVSSGFHHSILVVPKYYLNFKLNYRFQVCCIDKYSHSHIPSKFKLKPHRDSSQNYIKIFHDECSPHGFFALYRPSKTRIAMYDSKGIGNEASRQFGKHPICKTPLESFLSLF